MIRPAAIVLAVLVAGCAAKPLDFPPIDPQANAAWQAQRDQARRAALIQMGQNIEANRPTYQIVQPPVLTKPVQTNCYRFGNTLNCTSY